MWSSDDPSYGGPGIIMPNQKKGRKLPAQSAHLFKSVSEEDKPLIEKHLKSTHS